MKTKKKRKSLAQIKANFSLLDQQKAYCNDEGRLERGEKWDRRVAAVAQ